MPATLPTPDTTSAVYPPALSAQIKAIYDQGDAVLALPIAFGTADAAVLYTVPANTRLLVMRTFWEITTGFTGGTSSAIGLSSSNASYNTKGDLLGGASGDVAATLVAGIKGGTLGAKFGSNGVIVLAAGDTIRFDRITSAFTAGAGYVHIVAQLLPSS